MGNVRGHAAPDPAEALNALIVHAWRAYQEHRLGDAVALYREALALDPMQIKARQNLAGILTALGRAEEALAQFRLVAVLQPDYTMPYVGIGTLGDDRTRVEDTVAALSHAVVLEPSAANVLFNLGHALQVQGRPAEAAECYRRTCELMPDSPEVLSQFLFCLNYLDLPGDTLLAEHMRIGRRLAADRVPAAVTHANDRAPDRRLRVGYLSVDFRTHLGGYFLGPVFDHHDRAAVEIHVYSMLPAGSGDAFTAHCRSRADVWRDVAALDDAALADLIRRDRVDILVDLAGHTGYNRLRMLPHKPAPVQVTWLGYPNTTGLPGVDYRLVDAVSDPPGTADGHASETLVRLPTPFLCFRPPGGLGEVVPLPAGRTGIVTFGSFNTLAKLSPSTIRVWSELLLRVPDSRLLVKDRALDCPGTANRLRRAFAAHGVGAERLSLRGWSETRQDHFAQYGEIDIALDTFPYNGTITSCDALWAGAPLVTWAGDRHAARVGASLMTAIGLPELVGATTAEYVDIAAALAEDLRRLMRLRVGMRARLLASPLCAEAAFVRNLEEAYRTLWRRWCAGR